MAMNLSGHEGEIPIPITSSYVVHHHHLHNNSSSSTIKKNNISEAAEEEKEEGEEEEEQSKKQLVLLGANSAATTSTRVVRYRECLKNHAASMGGSATDGCGEFMSSGEEGSLEALKCSACSCHRNFHRKEVEGEPPFLQQLYHYSKNQASRHYCMPTTSRPPPAALIMPLGAAAAESDQETDNGGFGMMMMMRGAASHNNFNTNNNYSCVVKKRFRTKFTQEQKEKMLGFAERVGWKLQRQEEGSVQQFCQEIGVKRRVLKVWMHNNKHNFTNKNKTNNNTNTTTNTNSSNSSSLHIQ